MAMKPGSIAFVVAFFGAILVALMSNFGVWEANAWVWTLLALAGLVVGFINITREETVPFMVATLILATVTGVLAALPMVGGLMELMLTNVALVAGAAAIVVALKTVWTAGK